MAGIGPYYIDDVLDFYANTHRFDTGVATDADAAPVWRCYEQSTPTPLLTGTMALLDGTNTAGFYQGQITLSAANGFEVGKSYSIYISAAVNAITGSMHHHFRVGPVDANVTQWLGTAPATPTVAGVPEVDVTHLVGVAQSAADLKDFADEGYDPATNKLQGLTTADAVSTVNGLAANVITATSIASGAFTAAKFAAGAFDTVWNVLESAIVTASTIGLKLKTNLDAAVSSRSTYAGTDTAGTTTLLSRIIGTLATGTHQPQSGDSFARIGANGASLTALASQASVDDVPTNAELTTALAGADDATLAAIAAVQSDTNDLQARMPAALTAGGNMKSDMLALNGSTTAATQLARSANTMIFGTVDGTVSPTATVFECADITEATTDHYKGRVLIFLSGALLAQATSISTYSLVSGRGRLTVVALTEAPTAGDTLIIV